MSLDSKRARVNHLIRAKEVRLIDSAGKQVGVVAINEALTQAKAEELDLVEISPNAAPPVCRIMDFGKYLFEQGKRHKKPAKQIHVKEIKMRPVTDIGDYLVKLKKATDFLKDGNKVKFTVRFRGREMAYQQQGQDILKRVENDLQGIGLAEQQPKIEGRQMVMLFGPNKHK